jgi:hypothetical protein
MRNLFLAFTFLVSISSAQAGVFNLPYFLQPGENALGLEPEVTFTNDGGVGGNLKYQHGITDFSNATAILGSGTGIKKFRAGASLTFDFIPDLEQQPGIGIALTGIYYKYRSFGQMDVTTAPYVHKAFYNGDGNQIDPFFSFPIGPEFRSGNYNWAATVVVGAKFKQKDMKFHFVGEVGVSVNKAETYVSGGVIFYPGPTQ